MPKPGWYNRVIKGRSKTNLKPRGREGTVTPKMTHGWLTHGSIRKVPRMHKLRRKRRDGGLHKLRTVFEEPGVMVPLWQLSEAGRVWQGWGKGKLGINRPKPKRPAKPKKPAKRKSGGGRPKGPKGGIPPKVRGTKGGPTIPPPDSRTPLSRPRLPEYPPEVRAKIRQGKLSKALARHPANWQTTQPGPPVPEPKGVPVTGRKTPAVSTSAMYKHVVRAVYNRGNKIGYSWKHGAAKSAQEIAREKMKTWKYARARATKGGGEDASRITLTAKGKTRSRKHARENPATLASKQADYDRIVRTDPLL